VAGQVDIRVHISGDLTNEQLRRIQAVSPRLQLSNRSSNPYQKPGSVDPEVGDAEVLIAYHVYFDMAQAPKLRWLHLSGDGADHLRGMPVMRSDVVITNTRVFATPISEYVFASILAWRYHFPKMREQFQRQRIYPKNQWKEYLSEEVAGTTLAIIGHGSIGHRLARLAQAFDMHVIATRRSVEQPLREDGVEVFPASALRAVLARADIAVICLPLTDETEGLIGESELRMLKPSAYLVAVGRGKVIDEQALVRALRENWIAGAGLDVFAQRPLAADSPFFDLPNVIMTPHMSGVSDGFAQRGIELYCENLRRYLAGEPLLNLVDKRLGY
jgi:phosphoglycerate dehydrogenase-like enzyme